jgi:hypothetical protein
MELGATLTDRPFGIFRETPFEIKWETHFEEILFFIMFYVPTCL